jgi:FkbM family methyltransferase
MKKRLFKTLAGAVGKKNAFKLVDFFLHYNGVSFTDYFQYKMDQKELDATSIVGQVYTLVGINQMHGGEEWFIHNRLPKILGTESPVLFDVGANVGDYTQVLHKAFPNAAIYSFEPNPNTFEVLKANAGAFATVVNKGLSDAASETSLFMQTNQNTSVLASMYKEVITDLHTNKEVMEVPIKLDTLDSFCRNNNIDKINFLKIDTEGNELKVIKGGLDMILNKVDVIQMEFNEMNIVSRVFLKDFYELLEGKFHFYRLTKKALVPLGGYSSINEIFRYQDLILIRKELNTRN